MIAKAPPLAFTQPTPPKQRFGMVYWHMFGVLLNGTLLAAFIAGIVFAMKDAATISPMSSAGLDLFLVFILLLPASLFAALAYLSWPR